METTLGLSFIKDKKKVKRERVKKKPKKLFKRVKQTHIKKKIVKREQVERKPDTKGKKVDFSNLREDLSKTETTSEVFAIIYSKTIWLIWIKELSEKKSPNLPSTLKLFNQICKQDISQVDTAFEEQDKLEAKNTVVASSSCMTRSGTKQQETEWYRKVHFEKRRK